MITATHLRKLYTIKKKKFFFKTLSVNTIKAVDDVSLKIEKGKITGLLGINGAGKTTLIKMLTTMISPSSGSITLDELDAVKQHMVAKTRINLISGGERNIYWRLTAKENLEYFGRLYGLNKNELESRIEEILKIVELYDSKDITVEKYSKGMKQRLQIARGLINNPDYIFLDEPTLGLDVVIAKTLRDYVKKLAVDFNKGILLTTHYIAEAEELCDYIYILHKGKIIPEGTPKEIKERFEYSFKFLYYLDNIPKLLIQLLEKERGQFQMLNIDTNMNCIEVVGTTKQTKWLVGLINELNINIVRVENIEPSLEEIMLLLLK